MLLMNLCAKIIVVYFDINQSYFMPITIELSKYITLRFYMYAEMFKIYCSIIL